MRPEYGIEFAYNRQESRLKLDAIDTGERPDVVLSHTYAFVEERRAEAFATLAWVVEPFFLQAGMAAEHSEISVTGDSDNTQSINFWKPSFVFGYNPAEQTQYRFSVERAVGQLDFSDFAASADLAEDRQFSGNSQLRPERFTRAGALLQTENSRYSRGEFIKLTLIGINSLIFKAKMADRTGLAPATSGVTGRK